MNVITDMLSSMDSTRWLTSVSARLVDVFARSGLLISEDMTLLDALIETQMDANQQLIHSSKSFIDFSTNCKQLPVVSILSLTGALLWFESTLLETYRFPLIVSLVCVV
ncbi:unnamed protein product [Oppiella nova]|uniref:Uncharacterized protein n=1 Tax=Oppiella nova TaxID=334625 RepID=A0A7R9QH09_9ACAR|nr:unnamed protein product [Oppiella nova]CAG2165174.1 unnamed protein product [Oppiella nova]